MSARIRLAFLLIIIAWSAGLYADQAMTRFSLTSTLKHNDNIFLKNTDPLSVSSVAVEPDLKFEISEEIWKVVTGLNAELVKYNESRLDGNDVTAVTDAQYSTELGTFGANASYEDGSTLDRNAIDFLLTDARVDREATAYGLSYTISTSPTSRLSISGRNDKVEYEQTTSGINSYDTSRVSVSFTDAMSERLTTVYSVTRTDFETFDTLSSYTTDSLDVTVNYILSPLSTLALQLGYSDRTSVNAGQPFVFLGQLITPIGTESNTSGGTYYVSYEARVSEVDEVSVVVGRSDETNTFGGVNIVDRVSLKYKHQYDELLSMRFEMDWERYETTTLGLNFTDRDVATFLSQFYYKLDRDLDFYGSYSYLSRDLASAGISAKPVSNTIRVGIIYRIRDL